jgi:hypothetical protein
MVRRWVVVLSVLNLLVYGLCLVLWWIISPREMPTWELLLIIPVLVTVVLIVLQFSPSVRNDGKMLMLVTIATLPFCLVVFPAMLISSGLDNETKKALSEKGES